MNKTIIISVLIASLAFLAGVGWYCESTRYSMVGTGEETAYMIDSRTGRMF
jgi:hypothetical protein